MGRVSRDDKRLCHLPGLVQGKKRERNQEQEKQMKGCDQFAPNVTELGGFNIPNLDWEKVWKGPFKQEDPLGQPKMFGWEP